MGTVIMIYITLAAFCGSMWATEWEESLRYLLLAMAIWPAFLLALLVLTIVER